MTESLLTETREDHTETATTEDLSIEMTESLLTEMKEDHTEIATIEDLLIETKEDLIETVMIEDPSTEARDVSQEKATMILLDSTRARRTLTTRLQEERRALQSHMAMILSWQQRTERRLQLTGSRDRKASITEATNKNFKVFGKTLLTIKLGILSSRYKSPLYISKLHG